MPRRREVPKRDILPDPKFGNVDVSKFVNAIMHFTDLVIHTGVEQDALGRGGLAGVDVRADTDIAVALDGGFACHVKAL